MIVCPGRRFIDPDTEFLYIPTDQVASAGLPCIVREWREHRLTADELRDFHRDGFLVLSSALDADTVARLSAIAEGIDADYRSQENIGLHHVLNLHDLVHRDPLFVDLVDWPTTLPKVFGVLGWNIQLFHTQLIVTPPAPRSSSPSAYGWHQDNNRMNVDFETPPPHPRVSVKVGYFLSDLPARGMGNLCVVPGSHMWGRPDLAMGIQPDGAFEITARAGDAVLFDRRLWHAASTNASSVSRVFLTYGYSYRWLRPKSAMERGPWFDGCDPIRRQLLGDAPSGPNGYFDPQEVDVPLRAAIESLA
jgi:ectoine hydroxylase-related dioxygenase (phytanoyl-CoA dioxygenase family)